MVFRRLHRLPLIDSKVRIDHVGVRHCCQRSLRSPRASNDVDIRVLRLLGHDLRGEHTASATLPAQSLLDEALLLEVEKVNLARPWLHPINTVLVLMTISRSHSHDRGVQVLGTLSSHLGERLCLFDEIVSTLHLC